MRLVGLFTLAFTTATPNGLTWPHNVTRRLIMQKARRHPEGLRLLVGIWFQELFHSPLGVLFTFPSRYLCTIGLRVVFSLGRWSSQIPTGFHVSRRTQEQSQEVNTFQIRGYHPLRPAFPVQFF